MIYPEHIARCQHIKTNGTQCGSPALKKRRFCHFHQKWREQTIRVDRHSIKMPVLEDADSVQVALMEILRLVLRQRIDPKRAGLLLYGLQTASANLKKTGFEPELPTTVVIDPEMVDARPIGATAWSSTGIEDYDDLSEVLRLREQEENGEEQEDSLAKTLLERLGLPEPGEEPRPL
jgi:hypothetical protein